jgi:20S proteasome alpha/beta subunit
MGAQFLIAYDHDEEPVFIVIEQNGHVMIEDGKYVAIGAGEPLAAAVFSHIDQDDEQTLEECITWVYQAKKVAQKNPFVGELTVIWVIKDGEEYRLTEDAWEILHETPALLLAPVDKRLSEGEFLEKLEWD